MSKTAASKGPIGHGESGEHVKRAHATGILFAGIVGLSFYASKVALQYADAPGILAWRFSSALLAALIWWFFGVRGKRDKAQVRRNLPLYFGVGIIYTVFLGTQLLGLITCTSIVGAILNALVPVIVALLARLFLGEKLTPFQRVLMGVCTVAVIYMIWHDRGAVSYSVIGLALLVVSTLCISIYNLCLRAYKDRITGFDAVFYTSLVGTVVFWIGFLVQCGFEKDFRQILAPLHEPKLLLAIVFLGIGCIILSNALISYTLRYLTAARGSLFSNLATVISIAVGAVVLSEPFHIYHAVCSALVVLCLLLMNAQDKGREIMIQRQ